MNNKILFIFLSLIATNATYPQQKSISDYVIIIAEKGSKISQHKTQAYYWIASTDSIGSYDFKLSKLFLSNFSKNNISDCILEKEVDPFLVVEGVTYDYGFETEYLTTKKNLNEVIKKYKKRIQKIRKNWLSGQEEIINVYAVFIKGEFCQTKYHWIGEERTGYKGKIFFPISNFEYANDLWEIDEIKYILNRDYSNFEFDIIQNYP